MLEIRQIRKQYVTGDLVQTALDDVSLAFRDSEFVAVLGPSGSGKTTLLNIIGGLDRYDSGDLLINGVSTKEYSDRDWDTYRNHSVGFVFQSYNLIPHQTVLANVELALTISGVSRGERRRRAKEALAQVGLAEHANKRPNQLSGGQMQRVAIARALVNNPEILLADEPTGALDTQTGLQVMELLKEVARDRLVVMVTHNPELADQYATRIVRVQDGRIVSDSMPLTAQEMQPQEKKKEKKASMSFLTALGLSANNLRTKKGRTFLTAFGGSIGIIGIALIFAMSSGANDYIQSIEEDTLSEYPLEITSSQLDISSLLDSMMGSGGGDGDGNDAQEGEVSVTQVVTSMFSQISSNDLAALKTYIESGETDIQEYAKAIEYTYSTDPLIYLQSESAFRQVNPDTMLDSSSAMMASMMSVSMSSFYPLPENEDLYKEQYDLKAGRWPENYNECVLALTSMGSVSDYSLYALGLRDYEELDTMMEQFYSGEEIEEIEDVGSYTYEDILGISYKVVCPANLYAYDEEYDVWVDKSDNEEYMQELIENGEDLVIVGVVQPAEDAVAASLSSGINYSRDLIYHMAEQAAESEVVQAQMESPERNVFTGEEFGEEAGEFDMGSLITIDEDAIAEAFDMVDVEDSLELELEDFSIDISSFDLDLDLDTGTFDLSGALDFSSIDLGSMSIDMSGLDLSSMMGSISFDVSAEDMTALANTILAGYQDYLLENSGLAYSDMANGFAEFLSSEDVKAVFQNFIDEKLTEGDITVPTDGLYDVIAAAVGGTAADTDGELDSAAVAEAVNGYVSGSMPSADGLTAAVEAALAGLEEGEDSTDAVQAAISGYLEDTGVSQAGIESVVESAVGNDESDGGGAVVDSTAVMEAVIAYIAENAVVSVEITESDIDTLTESLVTAYGVYAEENGLTTSETITEGFYDYLGSESVMQMMTVGILSMIDFTAMQEQLTAALESYMTTAVSSMMGSYTEAMSTAIQTQMSAALDSMMAEITDQLTAAMEDIMTEAMTEVLGQISESLEDSLNIDADAIAEAFEFNMDSDTLTELITSITSSSSTSYESNLSALGYTDFDNPSEIDIYPIDFAGKEEIEVILDDYNRQMEQSGESEKVISYTDMVATMMSSVTTIVNIVSWVLVAFVAVSLIVSCIMISIITQISVMERTKEIGILRAIGASKRNISYVFNAETFIIGAGAGVLGVVVSEILIVPINALIHRLAESTAINAVLDWRYALALIIISFVITVLSGLIPSRNAAKMDPVVALRTE